ncbi:MAG: hypothetical protein HOL16_00205, partial [Alphaproteobacteria bacterium]|nr:hypothetical protein [Alphaproteobacteria bacterium]
AVSSQQSAVSSQQSAVSSQKSVLWPWACIKGLERIFGKKYRKKQLAQRRHPGTFRNSKRTGVLSR